MDPCKGATKAYAPYDGRWMRRRISSRWRGTLLWLRLGQDEHSQQAQQLLVGQAERSAVKP